MPYDIGLQAFAYGADQAAQSGGSVNQVFGSGTAQGMADLIGEKYVLRGLDKFIAAPATTRMAKVGKWLAVPGKESGEEMVTEVFNIVSDLAIMKDKSQRAQYYNQYMASHPNASRSQAVWANVTNVLGQIMLDGVGGLVSGSGMYAGRSLVLHGFGNGLDKGALEGYTEGAGDVLKNANFAQSAYRPSFSIEGQSIYSDIAGVPIKTVDDLAIALRKGLIKPSDVPIDYIVKDGNVLILNTRSSHALTQAGIPRSQWNAVNRTGVDMYESMLTNQLKNNGLTSTGTPTARMTGGH